MRTSSITVSLLLIAFSLSFSSCNSKDDKRNEFVDSGYVNQQIASANRELSISDRELIERYFEKRKWPYHSTGSGLFYSIVKHGNGVKTTAGSAVHISYSVSLLNGDLCYGADKPVEKEFVAGMGKDISGLEEAVLLLCEGDRAVIAISPHLAYGLLGDESKIPPRATIIFDLTLEKVVQNK